VKVFCPNCSAGGDFTEHVAGRVEAGQSLRPAGAVAATPQGRRIGVEDTRPAQHRPASGVSEHQTVAEDERQLPVKDEPGVIRAEWPQTGRNRCGANVHHELFGHICIGRACRALNTDDAGRWPRIRGQQRIPTADVRGGNVP
jgi:hypothetical protein